MGRIQQIFDIVKAREDKFPLLLLTSLFLVSIDFLASNFISIIIKMILPLKFRAQGIEWRLKYYERIEFFRIARKSLISVIVTA